MALCSAPLRRPTKSAAFSFHSLGASRGEGPPARAPVRSSPDAPGGTTAETLASVQGPAPLDGQKYIYGVCVGRAVREAIPTAPTRVWV